MTSPESDPKPLSIEEFNAQKAVDQTVLITDLSHQLEEARAEIDVLKAAHRELRIAAVRSEGARDALKELLMEAMKR